MRTTSNSDRTAEFDAKRRFSQIAIPPGDTEFHLIIPGR